MARLPFKQIPVRFRVPGTRVEFDWSQAKSGLLMSNKAALIVAYHPGAGYLAMGTDTVFEVISYSQAVGLTQRGGLFAEMVKAFIEANPFITLYGVLVAEPAGTKAVGAYTVTAAPAKASVIPLEVAGELVQVATAAGDTVDEIATKVAAAINANLDLPVTAAIDGVTASKIVVTAKWKGVIGNFIDLRIHDALDMPADAKLTITAMVDGAGAPDLTAASDAMAPHQFHHVVTPFLDGVALPALVEEMETRWDAMVAKEGQIWSAHCGTYGQLTTLGASLNSDALSVISPGGVSSTPYWIVAAAYAGRASFALTNDPSRQLRGLKLSGVRPPRKADRFDEPTRNKLLERGISTAKVTRDGDVLIERAITTYQTDANGLPDDGRLDVMRISVAAAMRDTTRNYVSGRFDDFKLGDDKSDWSELQKVMTPKLWEGHMLKIAKMWEAEAWVQPVETWPEKLRVLWPKEVDPDCLETFIPPEIIRNLMNTHFLIQPR